MTVEVLIAGAGPAGAACATLLAREGVHVLLVDNSTPRERPTEVFAPATLRAIRGLGLPVPPVGEAAGVCRGVLSVWGLPEKQFYDYELYACGAALAVDRNAYDRCLIAAAHSAGVDIVCGAVNLIAGDAAGWRAVINGTEVRARVLVDATGRSSRTVSAAIPPRRFRDRLVSFAFRSDTDLASDVLLLEAVHDGWWYASGQPDSSSSLVYLSDSDLVPRAKTARAEHFRRSFEATALLRAYFSTTPDFDGYSGLDARTGGRSAAAGASWLCVGDAAFSSDPLSGQGTRRAFESAQQAAAVTVACLRYGRHAALDEFATWCAEAQTRQLVQRRRAYASVTPVFHGQTFWRRRIEEAS
jgi:flavin-dependent dehydrogenase